MEIHEGAVIAAFAGRPPQDIQEIESTLLRSLEKFLKERLYPAVVEEALAITSRERRRWTKDGRLPNSGSGSFKRGTQTVHFVLHPQEEIVALASKPEIIAGWREQDAST